jgi:hypothetical protein
MENIYQKQTDNVKDAVGKASTEQLESDLYREELLEKYRIEAPYLDKSIVSVDIKSKTITNNNAPEGLDYHVGDVVNFASYSIAVKGDVSLIKHKLADLFKASNKFFLTDCFLFIEEYYFEKIEDNDVAIAAVKEAMRSDVAFIEQHIAGIKTEVDAFDASLNELVTIEIAAELDKRRVQQETLAKLNPFN